jgi:hypothetical protein
VAAALAALPAMAGPEDTSSSQRQVTHEAVVLGP